MTLKKTGFVIFNEYSSGEIRKSNVAATPVQACAVQLFADEYSNDTLVNAIEAYRWSGGIALLILKLGLSWG
jgi:hypothetical protein